VPDLDPPEPGFGKLYVIVIVALALASAVAACVAAGWR
jgi:hypothetical protein